MSGPCPIWPLPCDWKWASGDELPVRPGAPHAVQRCPHCTQTLELAPNDADEGVRRHKRGGKCKKGREVVAMNREGYHVMSMNGNGFWAEVLRPVMREGKYYNYYPAPVVAFIRWKTANDGASSAGVPKEFHRELEAFIAMDDKTQVAQLEGAILAYEYKMESRNGEATWDVPF